MNVRAPVIADATLGGDGFRPRAGDLARDVGRYWSPCGVVREWDPLRTVLLARPPASLARVGDPDTALMLARVDLARIRDEFDGLVATYRAEGVEVLRAEVPDDAPPNVIFARDLFWMTPEGAVIARMAAEQRAGEERHASATLAAAGVPIRATIGGSAILEGADVLWLGPDDVLVGVGRRTDAQAAAQLRALGFPVEEVPVPRAVQHLLGAVNVIDRDLAIVHPSAGDALLQALARRGIRALALPDAHERDALRANNVVPLGPRAVVMPAGCPRARAAYEAEGVRCVEVDVTEYLKAAGGPGCLTGIVRRG